jgi:hypothetical protein
MVSGAAAGTGVDLILFPLDTFKTRIQSEISVHLTFYIYFMGNFFLKLIVKAKKVFGVQVNRDFLVSE